MENGVTPELSSTSSEPFPAPPLPRCLPHFRETSHLLYLLLLYKIHKLKTLYISSMVSFPIHQARISRLLVRCPFLDKDTQQTLKNNFTFSIFFKEEFRAFATSNLQDSSSCRLYRLFCY